jgi:hypothetical protein
MGNAVVAGAVGNREGGEGEREFPRPPSSRVSASSIGWRTRDRRGATTLLFSRLILPHRGPHGCRRHRRRRDRLSSARGSRHDRNGFVGLNALLLFLLLNLLLRRFWRPRAKSVADGRVLPLFLGPTDDDATFPSLPQPVSFASRKRWMEFDTNLRQRRPEGKPAGGRAKPEGRKGPTTKRGERRRRRRRRRGSATARGLPGLQRACCVSVPHLRPRLNASPRLLEEGARHHNLCSLTFRRSEEGGREREGCGNSVATINASLAPPPPPLFSLLASLVSLRHREGIFKAAAGLEGVHLTLLLLRPRMRPKWGSKFSRVQTAKATLSPPLLPRGHNGGLKSLFPPPPHLRVVTETAPPPLPLLASAVAEDDATQAGGDGVGWFSATNVEKMRIPRRDSALLPPWAARRRQR